MENKIKNFRINVLDGFRAIAILIVLLFHYFSRWTLLYPYSDKYDFFRYGKMGVQFFFIISGFVILYSLENTTNFIAFWKKRMIRLFPSILVASIITYFVFVLFDTELLFPASHFFKNILASIIFIPPDTLASIFNNKVQLDYISGSYWSLWPEIQFYLFVSTIYFFNKNKFLITFFILSAMLIIINFILPGMEGILANRIKSFFIVFNFIESLPYFCFGVLFYIAYKNKMMEKAIPAYLQISFLGLLLFQIYGSYSEPLKLGLIFLFLFLFIALIYYPKLINFLENRILVKIGVSSYFLYLIHENIGVLTINKYSGFFTNYEFLFSLILIFIFVIVSIAYTSTIDNWINRLLKKIFLKKMNELEMQKLEMYKLLNAQQHFL
ncbi:acyltransferase family protein [Flavobacterium sp. WC2429]|uniref:Acyltransferase family protein n=1 Tax=Flavobacterium sp. WC2429 TaxID=3234140 RepID=A0AB39WKT5_9FLAO